jgi:hypothetical protein
MKNRPRLLGQLICPSDLQINTVCPWWIEICGGPACTLNGITSPSALVATAGTAAVARQATRVSPAFQSQQ